MLKQRFLFSTNAIMIETVYLSSALVIHCWQQSEVFQCPCLIISALPFKLTPSLQFGPGERKKLLESTARTKILQLTKSTPGDLVASCLFTPLLYFSELKNYTAGLRLLVGTLRLARHFILFTEIYRNRQ